MEDLVKYNVFANNNKRPLPTDNFDVSVRKDFDGLFVNVRLDVISYALNDSLSIPVYNYHVKQRGNNRNVIVYIEDVWEEYLSAFINKACNAQYCI